MINTRHLAGAVFAAGFTLAGCSATGQAPATPSAPCAAAPVAAESCESCAPCAEPVRSTSSDIQVTYVEFLVPTERVPELVAQKPDFNALLAEAKAGKVGALTSSLRTRDCQQATTKEVAMVRYPTSHAVVYMPPQPEPDSEGQADEGTSPAPSPAPVASPSGDMPKQLAPQDFEVMEVGFTLACTPTVRSDGKTIDLDLEPRRVIMEIPSGEHLDAAGFPCPPRFSVNEVNSRISVKNHVATHVATFQPAPGAKEPRTRVVFIRADFGE